MMSLQARETARPYVGTHHPLRAYAVDSPRAKARLIVLALLAALSRLLRVHSYLK